MPDIQWDESLNTGDAVVDQQHRDIHELIERLESVEDDPSEVIRALEILMDHVACHFLTEEELMQRAGYSQDEAEQHRSEHLDLTEKARQTVLLFRDGQLVSTKPVVEFLREWIVGHINGMDREFIDFVRARGEMAIVPAEYTRMDSAD